MPISTQQRTLAARPADWTGSVTLDQIDPALGINSITLAVTSTLASDVLIHNLDLSSSFLISQDTAVVELDRPNGSTLLWAATNTYIVTLLPPATNSSPPDVDRQESSSATNDITYGQASSGSADAALLIGTGTITLPVVATARIAATAPGNFGAVFSSQVGATVSTTADLGQSQGGSSSGADYSSDQLLYVAGPLNSNEITTPKQHVQIAPNTTGWSQPLGINGFDPSLGALQSVNVTLTTGASATLKAENLDPAAAYLGVAQTATIDLNANGSSLDSQAATVTTDKTLAAFDGTIDDTGPSGETLSGQTATTTSTTQLSGAALAAFTGAGTAGLTISSSGKTAIDGPGALSIDAALLAGVGIDVSYTYTPAVGALFDPTYYLAQNPDVAAAAADPYQHYLSDGWKEGRDPSAYFDTNYYLHQNPDVAAAGVDPLLHYAAYGWKEGRNPSLMFNATTYLAAHPTTTNTSAALAQYQALTTTYTSYESADFAFATPLPSAVATPQYLAGSTLPADPLVDATYYDQQLGATLIPAGTAGAQQAAWSYATSGWQAGLNPDAFFDTNDYLSHNPDVAAAHFDPLLHYETYGWKEGRDPSALFNTRYDLQQNPAAAASGIDPLLYFITNDLPQGLAPPDPLVDTAYYDRQPGITLVPTAAKAAEQAASNYAATGWQQGLDPDAFFDTNYYLSHNPDVAAAHFDPLLHYELYGWKEGRDPSAAFSTTKYLAAYTDIRNAGVDPLVHYLQYGQAENRSALTV